MQDLKIDDAEELCGYFSGVEPHFEMGAKSWTGMALPGIWGMVEVPWPNSITIFRQGVVAASRDEWGKVSRNDLRQQIRITILHELAHLLGMSEEAITEIGYG
jgi:predicted Zn-dependent protease with MMP-like domain